MPEPTLTCPTCRTEIKLTESPAAPLIADTRAIRTRSPERRRRSLPAKLPSVSNRKDGLATKDRRRSRCEARPGTRQDRCVAEA